MNNKINYKNNPLNGVGLKDMLTELVSHYGFDILSAYLNINCFKTNPSIESSVKFLKKTQWAREKVEVFYLYKYKNLPRVSSEQFDIPPRDRIIPDGQTPGEPAKLSLEDAQRMHEKIAKKSSERRQNARHNNRSGKKYGAKRKSNYSNNRDEDDCESSKTSKVTILDGVDPWAKWRK